MHLMEWKWAGLILGQSNCRLNMFIYWDWGSGSTQSMKKIKDPDSLSFGSNRVSTLGPGEMGLEHNGVVLVKTTT